MEMSVFEPEGFLPGVDPELLARQISEELTQALGEPLGLTRLKHLQDLSATASRHGLKQLEVAAQLEIVWDSLDSGNTELALSTISWVLNQVAHQETELDEEQNANLASQMLRVPLLAVRHPLIDTQTIRSLLFWMEYFTQNTGIDLSSRLSVQHQVELGLGNRVAAQEILDTSTHLDQFPRIVTEEIDCPLHHFRSQIAWAVNVSDYSRALSLYRDALEACVRCSWQCLRPDDVNQLLMTPLAWAGEGDAAWRMHEQSYRQQSESSQFLGDIASQLRYCAATWNLEEGLEILGTHSHWFATPEDPWDLLVAARGAAIFLARVHQAYAATGNSSPPVGFTLPGKNRWLPFGTIRPQDTVAQAQLRLEKVAKRLSLAFDARNSNNTISLRTSEILSELPVCTYDSAKPLLEAYFQVDSLQSELGLNPEGASWLLPALNDISHHHTPVPDFHLLDFTKGSTALHRFHQAVDSLDFTTLPPELSKSRQRLSFGVTHVALLGMTGHWDEMVDCALPLLEVGERLDDHRKSLRLACYLVQAYWQKGDLYQARSWLQHADDFIDATIPAAQQALLEDLALLAG